MDKILDAYVNRVPVLGNNRFALSCRDLSSCSCIWHRSRLATVTARQYCIDLGTVFAFTVLIMFIIPYIVLQYYTEYNPSCQVELTRYCNWSSSEDRKSAKCDPRRHRAWMRRTRIRMAFRSTCIKTIHAIRLYKHVAKRRSSWYCKTRLSTDARFENFSNISIGAWSNPGSDSNPTGLHVAPNVDIVLRNLHMAIWTELNQTVHYTWAHLCDETRNVMKAERLQAKIF